MIFLYIYCISFQVFPEQRSHNGTKRNQVHPAFEKLFQLILNASHTEKRRSSHFHADINVTVRQLLTSGAAAEQAKGFYTIGITPFIFILPQLLQNLLCLHKIDFYTANLAKYPDIMDNYTHIPPIWKDIDVMLCE